jgi:hypothetical protein
MISEIASAIEKVEAGDSDDQLCASLKVARQETPWIQVVSGILNLWWPFNDDPAARVGRLLSAPLPGWHLSDWAGAPTRARVEIGRFRPGRLARRVE